MKTTFKKKDNIWVTIGKQENLCRTLDLRVFCRKEKISVHKLYKLLRNEGLEIVVDDEFWDVVKSASNGIVLKLKK